MKFFQGKVYTYSSLSSPTLIKCLWRCGEIAHRASCLLFKDGEWSLDPCNIHINKWDCQHILISHIMYVQHMWRQLSWSQLASLTESNDNLSVCNRLPQCIRWRIMEGAISISSLNTEACPITFTPIHVNMYTHTLHYTQTQTHTQCQMVKSPLFFITALFF